MEPRLFLNRCQHYRRSTVPIPQPVTSRPVGGAADGSVGRQPPPTAHLLPGTYHRGCASCSTTMYGGDCCQMHCISGRLQSDALYIGETADRCSVYRGDCRQMLCISGRLQTGAVHIARKTNNGHAAQHTTRGIGEKRRANSNGHSTYAEKHNTDAL